MRRILAVAFAGSLLGACASAAVVDDPATTTTIEDNGQVTTTTTMATTSTTAPPPATTTTTVETPSTDTPQPDIFLVSNEEGLFQVDGDAVTQLVEGGPVQNGMSDGLGGIVYQQNWSGEIFWLPGGETEARAVVEPGAGGSTLLQDVGFGADGPMLWYIRVFDSGTQEQREVLYTMALDTGEVVELGLIGGFESQASVSVGGGLVVKEWWAEASHGFTAYDLTFEEIEEAWNPYGAAGETDCGPCPRSIDVAPDGSRVAWLEGRQSGEFFVSTLVVTDTDGAEMLAVPLEGDLLGGPTSLDLGASLVLINQSVEEGQWLPALRVDDAGAIVELPVAGDARWVSGG